MAKAGVCILGIYVADLAFRADRQPIMGETIMGTSFAMGPGGKGSNQTVAAARAGAKVTFISKLGKDDFGDAALAMYAREGVAVRAEQVSDNSTGAAYIFVQNNTGANAIIVVPGAAGTINVADVERNADAIRDASVFMTQLEQPIPSAVRGLEIAKAAGTTTILNTAPAAPLDDSIFRLCDYVTPNESEASAITGVEVTDVDSARKAADVLLRKGVGTVLVTLGGQGSLLHTAEKSVHVPIFSAGKVVDTTGAGDAFNGGFAAALARGETPEAAARFGSAVAGLSVTKPGTAGSMPTLADVKALLAKS
ncbi:MAG: ribokinase [Proteobacteria bacterium]|nr:ribokinase [Pseudomonadota bacterium]